MGELTLKRVIFCMLVPGVILALVFAYTCATKDAEAAMTGNATPSVNVLPGGELALSNTSNVQWGDRAAGATVNGTLNVTVTSNSADFNIKVQADQPLTSGANTIPSENFTYGSSYNSGNPSSGPTYQSSGTQFSTVSGTNVVTQSTGSAANALKVNVNYTLDIPANQTSGSYSATHTYTLAVQ